jgi:hypothetical protein
MRFLKKLSAVPLSIVGCMALILASCNRPSNSASDPIKERQIQEMQAKLDALSAQSAELNRQLADRAAAESENQRLQLEKTQANLDQQRLPLEADRQAFSEATPPVALVTQEPVVASRIQDSSPELVYEGKKASYDLFYNKLQEEGDWIESAEYGYIWRPTVAMRDARWRPYTDGRWVETDRGWTWDSRERFGWATYHYGSISTAQAGAGSQAKNGLLLGSLGGPTINT